MGKCGAITLKGTPCKLPGTRGGKCWHHVARPASVFLNDKQTGVGADKEEIIPFNQNNCHPIGKSKRLQEMLALFDSAEKLAFDHIAANSKIAREREPVKDEELRFDLLEAPDRLFRDEAPGTGAATSSDLPGGPGGVHRLAESKLDEELSIDLLDHAGSMPVAKEPEFDEELSLDLLEARGGLFLEDSAGLDQELSFDLLGTPSEFTGDVLKDPIQGAAYSLTSGSIDKEFSKQTRGFDEELSLDDLDNHKS